MDMGCLSHLHLSWGSTSGLCLSSPSGRGSGYLGLMYSQAPVRSYTKDRAGLQGDQVLHRELQKLKAEQDKTLAQN